MWAAYRRTLKLLTLLLFVVILSSSSSSSNSSSSSDSGINFVARMQPTPFLAAVQSFGSWWGRPEQPLDVHPVLPAARPHQPWPYRAVASASHASITITDSYAVQATVVHAPLRGITADMIAWWLAHIEGDAPYAGDGKVWSKYLQWHPRDHIHQVSVAPSPASSKGTSSSAQGPLWEICEFFMCPEPAGYTAGTYHTGPKHAAEYVIKEVTELQQLNSHMLSLTVPTRWGIGSSLWRLEHTWQNSPEGLIVSSSQVVGVVEPGWRPLWYARWRNALVQGLFALGRDPVWMLQQWAHHCIEEIGNLEHILPSLYAAADSNPKQAAAPDATGHDEL